MAVAAPIALVAHGAYTFAVRQWSHESRTLAEADEYLRLLQPGPTDRLLDVGGNVGALAVPAAHRCSGVVVYEPDGANAELLAWNLARNGAGNVRLVQAAVVGERRGNVLLYRGADPTQHSLLAGPGPAIVASAVPIDTALIESRANLVKIDVEGAEPAILVSCTRWHQVDVLVCEWHSGRFGGMDATLWPATVQLLRRDFPLVCWRHAIFSPLRLLLCSRRPADVARARAGWPGFRWAH